MKRVLGAAMVGLSMLGVAQAADLPSRTMPMAPLPVVAPAFTWTGFYLGINGGYAFSDVDTRSGGLLGVLGVSIEADGFVGGGQAGYNVQFGSLVAGFETDIQYSDLKASRGFVAAIPGTTLAGFGTAQAQLDYFGTVRARLGYALGSVMPYVTGGLIYGDVQGTVTGAVTGAFQGAPVNFAGSVSQSETFVSWVVGGGVEFSVNPNLSLKGEYLYSNLQDQVSFGDLGLIGEGELNLHIVRAGLNYRF